MRDPDLMKKVTDYASAEMKRCPGVSECAALELLNSVSLWLHQYYQHCDDPEGHPMPTIQPAMKGVHHLM